MILMSWKCKKNPSLQSKSFYNIEYSFRMVLISYCTVNETYGILFACLSLPHLTFKVSKINSFSVFS